MSHFRKNVKSLGVFAFGIFATPVQNLSAFDVIDFATVAFLFAMANAKVTGGQGTLPIDRAE
jgi:hypothetical protein